MRSIMEHDIDLLVSYADSYLLYHSFTITCHNLLKNFVEENGLRVHSINSRTKDISSLLGKLEKKEGKYQTLADITDLSAVRIITFFQDDVDIVAKIIESNFQIDTLKSIDKRKRLDPERFGYLSLHYICSLPEYRLTLPQYKPFKKVQCEIQVRSILQHGWAEIEHDLGYKYKVSPEMRRRFSRLAGLLEIGDIEFSNIRKEIEQEKNAEIPEKKKTKDIFLNEETVKWLLHYEPIICSLDRILARLVGAILVEPSDEYINTRKRELEFAGLITTLEVISTASAKSHFIILAFKSRIPYSSVAELPRGVSLSYLTQILIAENQDTTKVAKTFVELRYGSYQSQLAWAKQLVEIIHPKNTCGGESNGPS